MADLIRLRSSIIRPSDATQYAAGDEVSNSATPGSVVRATFDMRGMERGRILAASLDVVAGTNIVTTASDLELLLFYTGDVPAAVGDNVTNPIAADTRCKALARFRFDDTGWTGPLGTVAAGLSQYQQVMPTMTQPLAANVPEYPVYQFGYNFGGQALSATGRSFTAVLRALAAWNPAAAANTIGITLDIETP